MSLLAAKEGGSCIRSMCRGLRSAFESCNTCLAAPRGADEQLLDSVPPGEHTQEGALALLPEDVLDHVMSLLAAEEGGSCVRSTCRWLRSAFDRCNFRLVLRWTDGQLPHSFPARLLDLVRYSPCVSSLTLAEDLECMTWAQVLEAGGLQLLQRLERLTLMHRSLALNLEALAACSRLQHLCLLGSRPYQQPDLQLQPLAAACGGTLSHLEIQDCSSVRDFSPLAACAALLYLTLGYSRKLVDLTPLAACARLQQLRLSRSPKLHDLSALTACAQLQTLHITHCTELTDLRPLASCAALRELNLRRCYQISDLTPLASSTMLQRLDLRYCDLVEDLDPLAACIELRELDLTGCNQLSDLAPLAACTGLQVLKLQLCMTLKDLSPLAACTELQELNLEDCRRVVDLGPLAACHGLEKLHLRGCGAQGRSSLAALHSCASLIE